MEDFLKALGIPQSIIDQAKAEGADPSAIATKWKEDQETILATKVKKELEPTLRKEIGEETKKTVENSLMQKTKTTLGLSVANVKSLSFEEFLAEAKAEVEGFKTATDEKVTKELSDFKEKYSTAIEENVSLKSQVKEALDAKDKAVSEAETKAQVDLVINRELDSIKWGFDMNTPEGKARVKRERDILSREILEKFKVDKDGKLVNADGTPAVKPNEDGIYKTVSDYLVDTTTSLGLVKRSDARGPGEPPPKAEEGKKIDRSESSKLAEELGIKA